MKNGDVLSQAADDGRDAREAKGKPCCLTLCILFPPSPTPKRAFCSFFFPLTSFFVLL